MNAPIEPVPCAEMPDNTVVMVVSINALANRPQGRIVIYIRNHPSPHLQWRGTDGSYMRDSQIDDYFAKHCALVMVPA